MSENFLEMRGTSKGMAVTVFQMKGDEFISISSTAHGELGGTYVNVAIQLKVEDVSWLRETLREAVESMKVPA